jgi:hypothetical protein
MLFLFDDPLYPSEDVLTIWNLPMFRPRPRRRPGGKPCK